MSASEVAVPVRPETEERNGAGQADPILASTFQPRHVPRDPVIRRRLLDTLTTGIETTPLTLISAPAGAGKTVVAASWATAGCVSWPTSWVTVDDACDQPVSFWRCLCTALTRAGVELRRTNAHVGDDSVPTPFLMRLAADLLDRERPAVLVLDTADRSLPAAITSGLDFLLRHAHPRFRLVLCGRADPQFPLHRYRLTDSLTEIRQDALAFTVSETRELFAGCAVPISDETADALTELTEGWVAGLRLAAASLQHGADASTLVDSLARHDGSVAEYLFAEVLDALPTTLRRLLLRTSVCEQLWPDLVDVLTGRQDARQALAALVHANAFVQRSSTLSGCYRVHPLFRELLRAQLNYESAREVGGLHRSCARWFAASGNAVTAAEHAVAAWDWQYATELLVEPSAVGSLLAQDDSPYAPAVRSIPADLPGAEAGLLRAVWALRCGRPVCDADAALVVGLASRRCGGGARLSAVAVACAVSAATAAGDAESTRALALAERARQSLARRSGDVGDLISVVSICRASALLTARGAAAAGEAWAAALEECASPSLRLTCLAGLALAEALQGRLCHARELGRAAEELADACNVPRERRPAAAPLALAWVACDMLQHTEARRWAALAEQSAVGYLEALVAPLLTLLRGRMLRSRHEVTAADDDVEPTASPAWLRELQLIARADAHLARDGADKAVLIVDALPDPHSPRAELLRDRAVACGARSTFELCDVTDRDDAALDVRVDAWINRAYAHLEQGQSAQAVAAAERALHLAEPEQLRRPFRQSSAQFRRLLRLNPQLTAAAAWLSQPSRTVITMRRPATGPPTAAAPQLVDAGSLTDRETEVLRLLAELMSTEEIGAAMFVSVNTVRTHIRSILRKLAVSRRNEAVRRARELALV